MASATELREQALAKFKEAQDFAEAKGLTDVERDDIDEAHWTEFDSILAKAKEIDAEYAKAAPREKGLQTLKERMEWYTSRVKGEEVHLIPIHTESAQRPKSLGERFIESEAYKELRDSGILNTDHGKFRTVPVSMKHADRMALQKATTDPISTATNGAAAGVPEPDFLSQFYGLPVRDLVVRDLFGQGSTDSDSVSYVQQTARESAAAAVAQVIATDGAAKPQSSITITRKTAPVETIATWIAVTRQSLADYGQMRAIIDNQGRVMLQLEEENQLLAGNGSTPNLQGILGAQGVQTLDLQTGTPDDIRNLKGIRTAKRMVKTGNAKATADTVLLNPADSEEFDILTDNENRFYSGGPFDGFAEMRPFWGMRRIESEAIPAGTVLVGDFDFGASVLERQPITVYASDSHSDFFVKNLEVVLFEERLGFPIYFPGAFVNASLNTWGPTSGSGA